MAKEDVKKGCGFCSGCFISSLFLAVIGVGLLLNGILWLSERYSEDDDDDGIDEIAVPELGHGNEDSRKIAVIEISGVIMRGSYGSETADSEEIIRMIDKAQKDPKNAGIILSLDTPGGEVNAADDIYYRLMHYREETERPVVAMMRTIATSGGYYTASACDRIIAGRMTMTGSIGVIMSTYNFSTLLLAVGVENEVYKSGEMKDMLNPARVRTDKEKKIVQTLVNSCYTEFLKIVSESRKIPVEDLRKSEACDGRVLDGQQALEYGLIDKIGRMEDAVAEMENMLENEQLQVVRYESELGLLESFLGFSAQNLSRNVTVQLPGVSASRIQLKSGQLYFLPAGL